MVVKMENGEWKMENTEQIIRDGMAIVETLAHKYIHKAPGMTLDDFIGEGNMALVMAAQKWDPQREPVFAHYAVFHIRKAMEKILPAEIITKDITDRVSAGRPYTDEIAEAKELSENLSLRISHLKEREQEVIRHYYGLEGEERLTMTEIAEKMGYTRERIRQIRKTAERHLRKTI